MQTAPKSYSAYHKEIDEALNDEQLRKTLGNYAVNYRTNRANVMRDVDEKGLIRAVGDFKDKAAAHMEELYLQFKAEAEKRGAHVYRANTAEEANQIISDIAKREGVKRIIKSKSMTSEETQLNHKLEADGYIVDETDLGEWIIQLRHETPSHMVMPAIHLSRYQIAEDFSKVTQVKQEPDIDRLVKVARVQLRRKFIAGDMGISGCNFAIAECGAITTVTNEGNARMVETMPRVHTVLVGLDKLTPTIDEAMIALQILPRNATAQRITSYVSWVAGPTKWLGSPEGQKSMHIVFLDNGRLKIAQDPAFKDILRCVRCGACANVCPVYRLIGGHKMGYVYIGAVGLALTYLYHGADKARALVQNCIGCESCKNVCSAGIDLPRITREIRSRIVKSEGNNAAGSVMSMVMKDRDRFHSLLKFIKFSQKPLTVKGGRFIRHLPAVLMGGDQSFRQLPALAPKSFRQLFEKVVNNPAQPKFRVAIFSGCAQDFIYPEQLVAAVRVLNRHGVHVEFPLKQTCCGLPLEMMGQRETSLQVSSQNVNAFEPGKYDAILTLCASCAGHLKHGYPDLLKDTEDRYRAGIFASKIMDFTSFVYNKLGLRADDFVKSNEKVTYHSPCHMRNMGITEEPRALLNMAADYVPAAEEDVCCGFGGTFSVKFPELSAEIGRKKLKNSEATGAATIVTDCPGCVMQIRGVATANDSPIKVEHMSELLARAMK